MSSKNQTEKPRVLVVDDDHAIQRAHRRELTGDFSVVEADSYLEGLRLLQPDIAAVVSDSNLGAGPGGWALLGEARARIPDAPRILVSGTVTLEDAERAIEQGLAHKVLRKPCHYGDLLKALKSLLTDQAWL